MRSIKEYAQEIEIPHLVHFTNINNLQGIMENGLYPRDQLDDLDYESFVNDKLRLDGHDDSVSISIAFPNCQMFYSLWKGSDDDFCILGLNPSILWEHDCAFCKHNAADHSISSQNIRDLKTVEAFRGMYHELPGIRSREDQKLKTYDPTDVQAEILVFDIIDPKYILGAIFPTSQLQREFDPIMGGRKTLVHAYNKGFYGSRSYAREY